MKFKYFGEIDLNLLKKYYDGELKFEDKRIELSLNFEYENCTVERIKDLEKVLSNISKLIKKSNEEVLKDYKSSGEVKEYFEYHIDEIKIEEFERLFNKKLEKYNLENELLKRFEIFSISIHIEDEVIIVMDYTIGEELTDYLIAVTYNSKGELENISMES